MTLTVGPIEREGTVSFGDASLSVCEESIPSMNAGHAARDAWEAKFKRDVFARIIQTLNRIGWTVEQPPIDPHSVKHYGGTVARWASERRRVCSKGDLKGELEVTGRSITFEMWQGVNTPTRPDHGGRYERDKEGIAPYLLRLEMDRTRNRIRDYLCAVFTGYSFPPTRNPKMGPTGLTAEEMARHDRETSGHYRKSLGHAEISMPSNAIAADGAVIQHGARVWSTDCKGRVITGTAYYSLNDRWQIVTGRYGLTYASASQIFTTPPAALRAKRNQRERRKRLEQELQRAVKAMDFDRAKVLKAVLFPSGPLFAIFSKKDDCYFSIMYCGYRRSLSDAGRYTRDELRPYFPGGVLETKVLKAVEVSA